MTNWAAAITLDTASDDYLSHAGTNFGCCKRNGVKSIVRSHQLPKRQRGFEIQHDSMLLTIFSASNYGGACRNKGGVLLFDEQGPAEVKEFYAPTLESLRAQFAMRAVEGIRSQLDAWKGLASQGTGEEAREKRKEARDAARDAVREQMEKSKDSKLARKVARRSALESKQEEEDEKAAAIEGLRSLTTPVKPGAGGADATPAPPSGGSPVSSGRAAAWRASKRSSTFSRRRSSATSSGVSRAGSRSTANCARTAAT